MDRPRPLGLATRIARGLLALAACFALTLTLLLTAHAQEPRAPQGDQPPAPAQAPSQEPKAAPGDQAAPPASAATEPAKDQAQEKKDEPIPLERRPYRIRAWVSVRPGARLDARGRALAIIGWESLVKRLVGAPWNLEIADTPAPQSSTPLESLVAETIAPQAEGFDKAWIIRIDGEGGGFTLSGRALDVPTARLGAIAIRHARFPDDLSRDLMDLSLELFTPYAELGGMTPGGIDLVVQGSLLPVADPIATIVSPGDVFRPLRIGLTEEGQITRVQDIPFSYLRVLGVLGGRAQCELRSGIRDPLSRSVLGRVKMAAMGVRPGLNPTRLRLMTDAVDRRPASGYTVIAREVPNGPPRNLGFTDREGRLTIPSGFANTLIVLRVMAAGVEPLREFPVMPGEWVDEKMVPVDPLNKTVAIDTQLNAMRDELVDLIAIRNRMERRMKARAEAGYWDDIPGMLEEVRKYPTKEHYAEQLTRLKDDATKEQGEIRKVILTRHAQALIADTQAMVDKYLDDGLILGIEQAYKEAKGMAKPPPATKSATKSAPAPAPAAPAPAPAAAPAPAPPPQPAKPQAKGGNAPF